MKEFYIDLEKFKNGLYALEDTTKAPIGSARIMTNMEITDRGGIGPRPGTLLLGTYDSSAFSNKGFYNFRQSFDQNEYLIKCYDTYMKIYSKNDTGADWFTLKSGFTSDKEFGFVTSLKNTEDQDYVIFSNRYEDYSRWRGAVTQLNGALVGGETTITVDATLTNEIFHTNTATANSATTIDVAGTPWGASQWVNNYVYITSGALSGKVRKITANTTSQITFDTLGAGPGNVTFQIRKLNFPATGSIIYNGTVIAYTSVDTATTFLVASAHAAADNTGVAVIPDVYPLAPRGNRFINFLNRILVGNVRSGLSRDNGGALQGYASGGSVFVSKINDPFDFAFSATRVAGEGAIVSMPYGGGEITDIVSQEETAYVFKNAYIESLAFTQDGNDTLVRVPLKAETGSIGRAIKGADDIYFITSNNEFTSIGRVKTKDITPITENIGIGIKRLLDNYVFGDGFGIEYQDRIFIPCKSSSASTKNDITMVYNKKYKSFDGIWNIGAFGFQKYNSGLYFAESTGANVYQMLTGLSDVVGTDTYQISASYATHFINLTGSHANSQAMNSLYVEGYIKGNTEITFKAWKDMNLDPFLQFDFMGTEDDFLDGVVLPGFLGGAPLGLRPHGSVSSADSDGWRHFYFRVYFPFQYANHFSVGMESSGTDFSYDITRIGLGLKEDITVKSSRIKSI